MVVAALAKVCLIVFFPLAYTLFLVPLIFGEGSVAEQWNDNLSEAFWIITLYISLPCLLISGHFRLVDSGHYYLAPF
jgi:hypothetical protein